MLFFLLLELWQGKINFKKSDFLHPNINECIQTDISHFLIKKAINPLYFWKPWFKQNVTLLAKYCQKGFSGQLLHFWALVTEIMQSDCLSYDLLLAKTETCGFNRRVLEWMYNYLKERMRKQRQVPAVARRKI